MADVTQDQLAARCTSARAKFAALLDAMGCHDTVAIPEPSIDVGIYSAPDVAAALSGLLGELSALAAEFEVAP